MNIYLSHSREFSYQDELYAPIQNSSLVIGHNFIFPHKSSNALFNTKDLFISKKCDLVLAEVTYRSTGQGIELGWADSLGLPIICMHKTGSTISESLNRVSNNIFFYTDSNDMIDKIRAALTANG